MGMKRRRLDQMGISFLIVLSGPGPVHMASARVVPPSEMQSIEGGVTPCTGKSL